MKKMQYVVMLLSRTATACLTLFVLLSAVYSVSWSIRTIFKIFFITIFALLDVQAKDKAQLLASHH